MENSLVINNIENKTIFSLYKDEMKFEVFPKEENFYVYCSNERGLVYQKHFKTKEELNIYLNDIFGENIDEFMLKPKIKKVKRERIHEIDFLRGVLIIMMWVDHFNFILWGFIWRIFDIPYGSEVDQWIVNSEIYWESDWRWAIRYVVLFLFLFLSGISTVLTRSNFKRGLKVTGVAAVMTIGSYVITKFILQSNLSSGVFFYFGAIACLGTSTLIFSLFELIIKKCFKFEESAKYIYLGFAIVFIWIGLMFNVYNRHSIPTIIPEHLLENNNWFKVIIGLGQSSDDWLPLFPYLGYFFFGTFFGEIFYKKKKKSLLAGPNPNLVKLENKTYRFSYSFYETTNTFLIKPIRVVIEFFGRNTIWVYMFHQLINIAILFIIVYAKGYQLVL